MAEIELKPCPFCGGKAKFSLFMCRDAIACTECPACIVPPISGVYSKEELAAEWNRRAEQLQKHGRWKPFARDVIGYTDEFICSECECSVFLHNFAKECEFEYCPNCGARMDAGADQGGGAQNAKICGDT